MMKRPTYVRAAAAILLAAQFGCNTTPVSRQRAADTAKDVAAYRKQQQERIDRLNESYRDAFARQMQELIALSDANLRAGRDLDAQRLADALVGDDAVAAARASYQAAYHQASLELDRLDRIKTNLDQLSVEEKRNKVVEQLVGELYDVYRQLKNESDKSAGKQPTGGAVPKPKPAPAKG
jgi:hypothetical protein